MYLYLDGEEVCYWRKANQIHGWFVKNVQNGDDNCEEHEVSWEKLEELLEIINEILGVNCDSKEGILISLNPEDRIEKADMLLPVTGGFFFGGYEYDEYYFKELERTKEVFEKLLKNKKGVLKYCSSW